MSYSIDTAQTKFINKCMEVFKDCAITCEPHEEQKFCCLLQIALRMLDNLTDEERHRIELCHRRQTATPIAYGDDIEWDKRNKVYRSKTRTFTNSKDSEVSEEIDDEINTHASE